MPCWPVPGSRVNATPVPESMPRLPKTIATMLTAVPRSAGIRSWRRYRIARSAFHDSNTARTARSICAPGVLTHDALERLHQRAQVGRVEVEVVAGALGLLGRVDGVLERLTLDIEH